MPLTVGTPNGLADVLPEASTEAVLVFGEPATGLIAILSGVEAVAGAMEVPMPLPVEAGPGASSSEPAPPQPAIRVTSARSIALKTQSGYKFMERL